MRKGGVWLASFLVGCGGAGPVSNGPDADAGFEAGFDAGAAPIADAGAVVSQRKDALSGKRLKARVTEGEDGSKLWSGFYDSVRGDACVFALAEDGASRCLPLFDTAVMSGLYSDANCTQEVAYSTCPGAKYALKLLGTCPGGYKVSPVTEIAPTTLYRVASDQCVTFGVSPERIYYSVGPAIAPTEFVRGTVTLE